MIKQRLKRDLRKTGAGENEASELARLADELGHIKLRGLRAEARDEIAHIPGKPARYWHLPLRYAAVGSFALAILVVGLAQTAGPSNPLYGIRRGTEQIRAWIQPDYTETLVDERKAEVKKLIEQNAAPEKIEEAERIYEDTKSRSNQRNQQPRDSKKENNSRQDRGRTDRRNNFNNWWNDRRR